MGSDAEKGVFVEEKAIAQGDFSLNTSDATPDEKALKTTKDGKHILVPQPSDDPEDPFNWSWKKKHAVLLSLTFAALLTDWGMTWGSTLFEAQAIYWNKSIPTIANTLSGGIFLQGPGGLLAVPLTQRYGRLPVLFWSQFLSCIVVIGAACSTSYAGFFACRTLQGFFNTAPQVIGLTIVHDMFFFHERTRKINIWGASYLIGPYLGPFIAGFLIQKISWQKDFGVLAAFYGFSTLLIIIFGDETLYDRDPAHRKPRPTGIKGRIELLTGIAGLRATGRPTVGTVFKDLAAMAWLPNIVVPAIWLFIVFIWAIGITTSVTQFVKPPPYLFTDTAVCLLFLAPFIGIVLGEIWGHFFNDWLCNTYLAKHKGIHSPENRLWAVWPLAIIGPCGLILYGQTLEHSLSWVGIAFGWGMGTFVMLASTTIVSAYVLDIYPGHAALTSSWLNFWKVLVAGGFIITYINPRWIARDGPGIAFGVQGAIMAVLFATIVATQVWGKAWRTRFHAPAAEN
ncbi:MFS general substrate transporter [Trichodelitschia bisporula]|uniref:MFS general substrate transporter n=1 Tax=Trichodelitschia bisporula TaxID=703511 RepID=A0A6G1HPX1_9PEZI|nr:MFS general substrate transporter [Trichodelitschia bisporula]